MAPRYLFVLVDFMFVLMILVWSAENDDGTTYMYMRHIRTQTSTWGYSKSWLDPWKMLLTGKNFRAQK